MFWQNIFWEHLTEYERTKSWEFFTADMLYVVQEHAQI